MKQRKSLLLLLMMVWLPLQLFASHGTEGGKLNISEIVLGHLSDDYEWHIASYEGKSISIPLPIIVRSLSTGQWTFC